MLARRVPDTNPDLKKRYTQSHPEIAFKFWKENGIKLLFTLEAWGGEKSKKEIFEFVRWIIDNDYKCVVAGFEFGNESFYSEKYASLAPIWTEIVLDIKKMWPDVKLGINLADKRKNDICLLMVNTKSEEVSVEVTSPGREFAAPVYATLSCPEKFLDCREIPGDGKFWRQVSWEDTQMGYDVIPIEKYEGMKPKADKLIITIAPHTVQSVTFMTCKQRAK